MMAIGIPEYRLPRDVLQAEIARILAPRRRAAAGHGDGPRLHAWPTSSARASEAIFLATGASKSRRLGVPGDELRGVIPATLFLKEVNLGESPRLSGDGGGRRRRQHGDGRGAVGPPKRRRDGDVAYRRGARDMPAQAEEVEAAEREGIVVRRRPRTDRGRRPRRRRGRPFAATSSRARRRARRRPRDAGRRRARPGSCPRPRSSSRSARSPIRRSSPRAPASRSAAGPASSPTRGPWPRAGPAIFAGGDVVSGPQDDHRGGRRRPPRRGVHPRVPRRRARRRGGDPRGGALPRRAPERRSRVDLVARPRVHPALPVVDIGSFAATQPGFDRRRGPGRGGPLLPVRRGLRLPVRPGRRRPGPGRRAAARDRDAIPIPAAGPADQSAQGGVQ